MTRRTFLKSLTGISGVGLTVGFYTWQWEPHWVEFVRRPLRVLNLPGRLRGVQLVQLTDLHIGPQVDDGYLLRTFDRVRASNLGALLKIGPNNTFYNSPGRLRS